MARTTDPTSAPAFGRAHRRLLYDLLATNTVSPLEGHVLPDGRVACERFEAQAHADGLRTAFFAPADQSVFADPNAPALVRHAFDDFGHALRAAQPNLVLVAGRWQERARTVMVNVHLDTVAGGPAVRVRPDRFEGRGSVDMKGPAAAVLAAVPLARRQSPGLFDDIGLIVQAVHGEEGGAMGWYGTRDLVRRGYVGRLNVFAEPTGGVYFDHATTSMTARIQVDGPGATDDAPHLGVNATLLLAHLTTFMAEALLPIIAKLGGKLCVAGVNTGLSHNRVYGTGRLMLNLQYPTPEAGHAMRRAVEAAFADARRHAAERLMSVEATRLTSRAADDDGQCRLSWLKSGLPVLANRDASMEKVIGIAGICRNPDDHLDRSFTCDAIWANSVGSYTIVYGPGALAANGAHTDHEFIEIRHLEAYAQSLARVIHEFRRFVCCGGKEQ